MRITIDIPDFYDLKMIMNRCVGCDNHVIKLLDWIGADLETDEVIYTCPIFDHFVNKEFDVHYPIVSVDSDGFVITQPLDIGKFKKEN